MPTKTKSTFDSLPDTAFARQPQILEVVPFSPATMWRRCKDETNPFPKPVKLSERVTAWNVGAVRAWLKNQSQA